MPKKHWCNNQRVKKVLPFLIVLPLISPFVGKDNAVVIRNFSQVEVSSGGKAESEVVTEINGERTVVKSNQPGTIEVTADEKKVEVKTSGGITPTIIISEAIVEKKLDKKKNLLYTIWYEFIPGKIINFFKRFFK